MGLFAEFILNKLFSKSSEKDDSEHENDNKYETMSTAELLALDDSDFYEFLLDTLDEDNFPNFMKKEAANILTVMTYEMEVNNGGIDQFFVNSSRKFGPFVSEALECIGALKHKKLFDELVMCADLDLEFLAIPEEEEETETSEKQLEFLDEKHDFFDEFDDSFYELEQSETIESLLNFYAKSHIDRLKN